MFNVCTLGDMAHIDTLFNFLPHMHQHVDACVADVVCAAEGNILAPEGCIKIRGLPLAQQLEERLVIKSLWV